MSTTSRLNMEFQGLNCGVFGVIHGPNKANPPCKPSNDSGNGAYYVAHDQTDDDRATYARNRYIRSHIYYGHVHDKNAP